MASGSGPGAGALTRATETPGAGDEEFEFPVPATLAGERVDRAVALLTGFSRADVQALITRGVVLVGGRAVAKSHRLEAGDVVTIAGSPEPPAPPLPETMDLDVRYEDRDLAVLCKPPGLVVHPGAGHETGTLVHGLLDRWPAVAGVGDPARPGIVHRLDRGTSGLMVVALSAAAYTGLVEALGERRVERRYRALVWGRPEPDHGAIDAPIGRSPSRPTRMAVTPAGRDARTQYEVLEFFDPPGVSLLDLRLETGRTHQIRVHCAAIGTPVVGDPAYGGDRDPLRIDRPFLHAYRLAFDHPVTGQRVEVEDDLPPDLAVVVARLREPAA